jgi:Flp pilus assembly pilin Flp
MKNLIARFLRDEQGQDIIEYALIGSFVSFGGYIGAGLLGTAYNDWFTGLGGSVDKAASKLP